MPIEVKDVISFVQHRALEVEDAALYIKDMRVGSLAVLCGSYKTGHLLYKHCDHTVSLDDNTVWQNQDRQTSCPVRLVKPGSAVTLVVKTNT